MTQPAPPPRNARPAQGVHRVRVGAVIAVALVVAFLAWLIFRNDDDNPSNGGAQGPASSAASVQQLRGLAQETGEPVYWAGRRNNYTYELTRTTDGNIYVRYLPPGVAVGSQQPKYLTIGTYPRRSAVGGLRRQARRRGSVSFDVPNGGIAVYSRQRPNSVYLAVPGDDVQVEVYDPSAKRARQLARSGNVRPIG